MRTLRIGLHSLILAMANIGCIVIAYAIYYLLKPANQIAVQAPLAAALSIATIAVWSLLIQRLAGLGLRGTSEFAWTYLAAFVWIPFVFVPLHYLTQGYLTSFGNILAIWAFQLPVNLLAVLATYKLAGRSKAVEATASSSLNLRS